MQSGHTNIGNAERPQSVRSKGGRTFIGNREICGSGSHDRHAFTTFGRWAPHNCMKSSVQGIAATSFDHMAIVSSCERYGNLLGRGPRQKHRRRTRLRQQFRHDRRALFGRLSRSKHGFGQALTQRSVMINLRETDISKGQTSKRSNGIVGADCPRAHLFQQLTQSLGVHSPILAHCDLIRSTSIRHRLGPPYDRLPRPHRHVL
jgi:hypothetical protein